MASEQSFVRSVLSEPDGTGSAARVCTVLSVLAAIGWVTFLVVRNHAIPDLTNVATWLAITTGSTYGLNKVATALSRKAVPGE